MRRIYWFSGGVAFLIAILLLLQFVPRIVRVAGCPRWITLVDYLTPSTFRVTFLGGSTLIVEEGNDAIIIDGFVTRPALGFFPGATSVSPDNSAIDGALATADISTTTQERAFKLAAVIVNHSHYDHVLDASAIAQRTGALLIGSSSTANIGRGWGLPEEQLRTFGEGESKFCFARFPITVVRTGHVPLFGVVPFPGEIAQAGVPQTVADYKEGGTFAIFIRRRGKTLLIQGSAGFAAGALQGRQADVVYLAVGGLSTAGATHRDSYWNEVIGAVAPRRIFPIHWDDLSGAVSATSDGTAGIDDVTERGQSANIEVVTPAVAQKVNPFDGL